MKRISKPFSIEIKKSRVSGQRHHLPPRRLFKIVSSPTEVTQVFQKEPHAVGRPSSVARILPSIIEPAWGSQEPVEPVRRKHSAAKTSREQMELDLTAASLEEALSAALMAADSMSQADIAAAEEDATPSHDIQPTQGECARLKSSKPQKKAARVGESVTALESKPKPEPIQKADVVRQSTVMPSRVDERRPTKRQSAAAQLPRHERWKRRLHPASW
jgi:hypothetical protein